MVDGSASRRTSNAATIAAERPEESAVARTGMPAMEAVNDVKPVLEGFKCFDGLLELKAIERCVLFQTLGYGGIRIKSLVLKKENDAFGLSLWSRRIGNTGKKRGGNSGTQWLLAREQQGESKGVVELGDRTRAYYGAHAPEIKLDLRWRHEMSDEARGLFEQIAGETNAPFAWEPSAR